MSTRQQLPLIRLLVLGRALILTNYPPVDFMVVSPVIVYWFFQRGRPLTFTILNHQSWEWEISCFCCPRLWHRIKDRGHAGFLRGRDGFRRGGRNSRRLGSQFDAGTLCLSKRWDLFKVYHGNKQAGRKRRESWWINSSNPVQSTLAFA